MAQSAKPNIVPMPFGKSTSKPHKESSMKKGQNTRGYQLNETEQTISKVDYNHSQELNEPWLDQSFVVLIFPSLFAPGTGIKFWTMMNPIPDLRINSERMRAAFNELANIGATSEGGVNRPTFSEAHLAARRW